MDPKLLQAALEAIEKGDTAGALEILRQVIAAAAAPSDGAGDSSPPPPPLDASQESADMKAALAALSTLTGRKSAGEAVGVIQERFAKLDEIAQRQATLDDSSRRELVGELVKLGAEIPATAWEDPEKRIPVARLRNEPVESLRSRVVALSAGRPKPTVHTPPEAPTVELTAAEEQMLTGKDPAVRTKYLALRAERAARRAG